MSSMEFKYIWWHLKRYYLGYRGSIWGPILLNIYNNDLDDGTGHTLLKVQQKLSDCLVHQMVVLPFRAMSESWRSWPARIPWSRAKGHACLWGGTNPIYSPIQAGQSLAREQSGIPCGHRVKCELAVCPCCKGSQQHPCIALGRVLVPGQGRWMSLFLYSALTRTHGSGLSRARDLDIQEQV